jgi:hypothetical protein
MTACPTHEVIDAECPFCTAWVGGMSRVGTADGVALTAVAHPCDPEALPVTAEMVVAGRKAWYSGDMGGWDAEFAAVYRAMAALAPAPADPPTKEDVSRSAAVSRATASAYTCIDCGAAEGEWHKRYCLLGASIAIVSKPK